MVEPPMSMEMDAFMFVFSCFGCGLKGVSVFYYYIWSGGISQAVSEVRGNIMGSGGYGSHASPCEACFVSTAQRKSQITREKRRQTALFSAEKNTP